ncbi:uncharacterized protein LOC129766143 [Toxorhynchites rutilus septentrionalis]|uniref:uncharacterized protein LOC129766143 n=1 Tax=Toxorhynchites rutilus septentrionalis TaxID=329112 RepID=UPI00247B148C|nr:uncharacterized protein LOC129766143 [Toxorhynchites rutilus septentrionalis]
MEKLIRERKSLDPRLKRVSDMVTKLEPETAEEIEIETELDVLGGIWSAYCSVHKRILDVSDNDELYDDAVQHQCRVEKVYIALKNRLSKVLKAMPLTDLKLPRMNLPAFSGNYLEWQSFIDLFKSMVDQNPSLKDSQKSYFLKTNLTGEAASLISHLKIEDVNYGLALQKLQSRHDKPLEIAHKHIERFLNQPALTSPSAHGLRSLHDVSDEVVRALQAMQREDRDTWLLFILIQKLDHETKQLWYQKVADMPEANITLEMFLSFIDSHSFALQSAQPVKPRTIVSKPPVKPPYRGATTFVATNISSNCNVCSKSAHPLYQCGKFVHMSSEEKLSLINSQMLCRNCLKDHRGESCRSGNCRKCGLLHHTLLHAALTPTSHAVPNSGSLAAQSLISALDAPTDFDASNVLLATVAINVLDKQGRPHACRAVLDCASQVSFISQSFCNELGLELQEADMNLEGISATPAHADKCVSIVITSRCTDYRTIVPCMVLERITKTLPVKPANIDGWPMPHSINLADPVFHRPSKISVLLGIDLFFQLLEPGKIIRSPDGGLPTLQNTKLGWVVAGRYREPTISPYTKSSTCLLTTSDDILIQQLRRFWELEECCTSTAHFSEEEKLCEDHFHKYTTRDDTGKFIVRLPFLHPPSQLGDSRQTAEMRLFQIERKLQRNPHLKQEYHAFLREYCELGHMTLAEESSPRVTVYLLHRCAVKDKSSTTKCRVVFNASAKTTKASQ